MRTMTRETLAAALEEVARIRTGFVPGPAELADAPILSQWSTKVLPGGMICLIGEVNGHPKLTDGWCTTSVVFAADLAAGWVRTVSRYYQLGPKLGEELQ